MKFFGNEKRLEKAVTVAAIAIATLTSLSLSETTKAYLTSSNDVGVVAVAGTWTVSNLSVIVQDANNATATWTALGDYPSYTLQWSQTSDFVGSSSATVSGSSYSVTSLASGSVYYFRIQAVGATSWSPVKTVTTPTAPSITSSADVVAYDSTGKLWNFGPTATNMTVRTSLTTSSAPIPNEFFVTDWDSDGIFDLILNQKDGQLIFRKGLANGGFNDFNIGNGWQDFEITVGKWRKTDPNPSIIAKQLSTNYLYHYPNPYGTTLDPKIAIGTGWGPFSPLNIVDFDQDGNMDVIARKTTTDEMLLYRTDGGGGFIAETRQVIGSGWNMYDSIRMVRGRGGVGHVGVLARGSAQGNLAYYEILKNSWAPAVHVSNGWVGYKIAGN